MNAEYHFILTVDGTLIGGQHAKSTIYGTLSGGPSRDAVFKDLLAKVHERDAYMTEPSVTFFSLEPNRFEV